MRRASALRRRRSWSLHMLRKSGHRLGNRALLGTRLVRLLRRARRLRCSGLLLLRCLRRLRLLSLSLSLALALPLPGPLAEHHADQVLLHALQLHLLLCRRKGLPLRTSHQRVSLSSNELLLLRSQGQDRTLLARSRRRSHVARSRRCPSWKCRWGHGSGKLLHTLRADR